MPVKYDIYKNPPASKNSEQRVHVRVKNDRTISTHNLAKEIEYATSLTAGDIKNVFSSFSYFLAEHLANGHRVHVDGVGTFQLSVESQVSDPDKVRSEHIQARGINFFPEKTLKAKLSDITFERSRTKSHSPDISNEELLTMIESYFRNHETISRAEFQQLTGFTRSMAVKRINELIEQGILKPLGTKRASLYALA